MDGYLAQLDRICDLAERHDALVMVDDSHAVGVVGPGGRGTPEHYDVVERVDILTGTLGKAIGGASGGYVSGRREIVELLRQRARPYLFSNSLAPPVVAASLRALELIEGSHELRDRLRENTAHFRGRMTELGFDLLPGEHPIVPVMIGDEVAAARLSATARRARRLRRQLLLPGRAARHGAHPHADVGRAHVEPTSTSQPTASPTPGRLLGSEHPACNGGRARRDSGAHVRARSDDCSVSVRLAGEAVPQAAPDSRDVR